MKASAPGRIDALKAKARHFPGYSALRLVWHIVGPAQKRSEALLKLLRPTGLFQPYGTTVANRHPTVFSFLRAELGDKAETRLLSFGCSTGEEVFSLRRHFPLAQITGMDINARSLKTARQRLKTAGGDAGLTFVQTSSAAKEPADHYDAILALSVFRHGDLTSADARCDHLIRFEDFEKEINALARALKPGRLFVICHAHFRFTDTAVGAGFEKVLPIDLTATPQPLFGKDNQFLEKSQRDDGVFRKPLS
jgi:SAM-dependent methyltransferase